MTNEQELSTIKGVLGITDSTLGAVASVIMAKELSLVFGTTVSFALGGVVSSVMSLANQD